MSVENSYDPNGKYIDPDWSDAVDTLFNIIDPIGGVSDEECDEAVDVFFDYVDSQQEREQSV